MYGPTPKISWMSRIPGPCPVGDPHGHRHAVAVDRDRFAALGCHGPECSHKRPSRIRLAGKLLGGLSSVTSASVRLEEFDYDLPAERIAQVPIEPRDAARLLIDRGSAPPEHATIADLPLLRGKATSSWSTRPRCCRPGCRCVELTAVRRRSSCSARRDDRRTWEALVRPAAGCARARTRLLPTVGRCFVSASAHRPATRSTSS